MGCECIEDNILFDANSVFTQAIVAFHGLSLVPHKLRIVPAMCPDTALLTVISSLSFLFFFRVLFRPFFLFFFFCFLCSEIGGAGSLPFVALMCLCRGRFTDCEFEYNMSHLLPHLLVHLPSNRIAVYVACILFLGGLIGILFFLPDFFA